MHSKPTARNTSSRSWIKLAVIAPSSGQNRHSVPSNLTSVKHGERLTVLRTGSMILSSFSYKKRTTHLLDTYSSSKHRSCQARFKFACQGHLLETCQKFQTHSDGLAWVSPNQKESSPQQKKCWHPKKFRNNIEKKSISI